MFHLYKLVPNSCIETFGSFETVEAAKAEFDLVSGAIRHMSSYSGVCEDNGIGSYSFVTKLSLSEANANKWAMVDEVNGCVYDPREAKCYL